MSSKWGAQSSAYADLHRITFARCNDIPDYIGRLRTAQHKLSITGLELSEPQLVYILLAGLGVEFESWISGVRRRNSVPPFDSLAEELIEDFKHKAKPPQTKKSSFDAHVAIAASTIHPTIVINCSAEVGRLLSH